MTKPKANQHPADKAANAARLIACVLIALTVASIVTSVAAAAAAPLDITDGFIICCIALGSLAPGLIFLDISRGIRHGSRGRTFVAIVLASVIFAALALYIAFRAYTYFRFDGRVGGFTSPTALTMLGFLGLFELLLILLVVYCTQALHFSDASPERGFEAMMSTDSTAAAPSADTRLNELRSDADVF